MGISISVIEETHTKVASVLFLFIGHRLIQSSLPLFLYCSTGPITFTMTMIQPTPVRGNPTLWVEMIYQGPI